MKLFWSANKQVAMAEKAKLESQLEKLNEFLVLYERSINNNFSQTRMNKMLILSNHLPNVTNSSFIQRYRIDNLNQNGYYEDPLSDWIHELESGSRAPIDILLQVKGEIERSIVVIEKTHYPSEVVSKIKYWGLKGIKLLVSKAVGILIGGALAAIFSIWFIWFKP